MKNKKCPKCKTMTMEETTGGLSFGTWYQNFECNKCGKLMENVIIKDWIKKGLMKTTFSHTNTISTPIIIRYP